MPYSRRWVVPLVTGVVIESDWPEYEDVWKMVERRIEGGPSEEVEVVRRLFEVEVTLGNCPTPEPSIRRMVEHYYRSHGILDTETLADTVLNYVANSLRFDRERDHP